MKKTYIKPENAVVCLNAETLIAQSIEFGKNKFDGSKEVESRESIKSQDAWEMWE